MIQVINYFCQKGAVKSLTRFCPFPRIYWQEGPRQKMLSQLANPGNTAKGAHSKGEESNITLINQGEKTRSGRVIPPLMSVPLQGNTQCIKELEGAQSSKKCQAMLRCNVLLTCLTHVSMQLQLTTTKGQNLFAVDKTLFNLHLTPYYNM